MTAHSSGVKRHNLRALKLGQTLTVNISKAGKHKYWRLYITANNGDSNYTGIAQLEMFSEYGGANVCTGGTPSASSEWTASRSATEAFDGDYNTEWVTAYQNHLPSWVQYEFPSETAVVGYKVVLEGDAAGVDSCATTFVLQHSDDGVLWVNHLDGTISNLPSSITTPLEYEFWLGDYASNSLTLPTVAGTMVPGGVLLGDGLDGAFNWQLPQFEIDAWLTSYNLDLPSITLSATLQTGFSPTADLTFSDLVVSGTIVSNPVLTLDLSLPSLSVAGQGDIGGANTLPALTVSGTAQTGWGISGTLVLPKLDAEGSSGNATDRTLSGAVDLPDATMTATLATGTAGTLDASLKRLVLAAEGVTGTITTGTITLPVVEMSASGHPEITASIDITLPVLQLQATGTNPEGQPSLGQTGIDTTAYAMNLNSKGLTEFTNYGFNSFAKFNGQYLMANEDGIFAMEGDSDNGTNIAALVQLPVTDFRELDDDSIRPDFLKRVVEAFVGYRTDGNLTLTVIADETTSFTYNLTATGMSGIHTNRSKFRKGVKGRYWQIELRNVSGADFELESLEAMVAGLGRRLR